MIAPHELKNKVFNKTVRGYSCSEVTEYIEFIIEQYTELYRENLELKNELHKTNVKYSELHNDEDAIRAVIVKAQKLSENIVEQAKKEAAGIIEGAKEKCMEYIEDAEKRIDNSNAQIERTRAEAEAYKAKLFRQYAEHIKLLQELDTDASPVNKSDLRQSVSDKIDSDVQEAKDNISEFAASDK